jgi:16S rRNA (cytosine967-C5)-methyltransferase
MSLSPARLSAFDILLRTETQEAYASELLNSERMAALSPVDRRLCMEIVMGVLRWRSWLDNLYADLISRPLERLDVEVAIALRMGAYQLVFLKRVPGHAAVNDSVSLTRRAKKSSAAGMVNAVLRKMASATPESRFVTPPEATLHDQAAGIAQAGPMKAVEDLSSITAHPCWLVERWICTYGTAAAQEICLNDQRIPTLTLRLPDASVRDELAQAGVELAPGALLKSACRVLSGDPTHTVAYDAGRVFIQDEASQLVAALVGKGSCILDCCAAPGGKTAVIAGRNPGAAIIAVDVHEHRARLMRRLVHAPNVRIIAADARALPVSGFFDRILADVPCSGTGTLARHPEIKWRFEPEDLADLHARQVAILRAALQHLAPGGRLIYASCSLEPEENEQVIEEVVGTTGITALPEGGTIRLVDCRTELIRLRDEGELAWPDIDSLLQGPFLRTIPGVHPCDGFFAAVLERSP